MLADNSQPVILVIKLSRHCVIMWRSGMRKCGSLLQHEYKLEIYS
jgi:hypothetical protein